MSYKIAILSLIALQAYAGHALPPCVCTRNLLPVCGSDGETYSNTCILECERHKGKTDLVIAKDGPCDAATFPCICTYEYKPVCGTDGETYSNRCVLLCKRNTNKEIDVVSEGECKPKTTEPPCICTEELNPVCGSDGNTYANPCLLNCATAKNSQLSIKNQGNCDNSVKVVNLTLPEHVTHTPEQVTL